jgi:hypothetical protein
MTSELNLIIDNISTGIVLFDKHKKIKSFNKLIVEIWKLDSNVLFEGMLIGSFFEILRENFLYPETEDIVSFNNKLDVMFAKNNFQSQKNIILMDGRQIEEKFNKFDDFLLITFEDKTNLKNMTYNFNLYKQMLIRIIEKSMEAMLLVDSSGHVELYNQKFIDSFMIDIENMEGKHINDLLKQTILTDSEKIKLKTAILGITLNNKIFNVMMENKNEMQVLIIPLPNGSKLLVCKEMEINIENYSQNYSHELMQNLENINYQLLNDLVNKAFNPLNTIIGFSEMLSNFYLGSLNLKQTDYINKINKQALWIKNELEYKLEIHNIEILEEKDIEKNTIDLEALIAFILYQHKFYIKDKKLKIETIFVNNDNKSGDGMFIETNEILLKKAIFLLMLYLIENNVENGSIYINCEKIKEKTILTFKDNVSNKKILETKDLLIRYDVALILRILKKLQIKINYGNKSRNFRFISLEF